MFDPEGNVFVPGTVEVKRKVRRDGKFMRPTSCTAVDNWVPSHEARGMQFPWSDEEGKDKDGNPIPEEQLWAHFGHEWEWEEAKENVVVRPPLVEIFKDRMSVEAVLFIHRCALLLFLEGGGCGGGCLLHLLQQFFQKCTSNTHSALHLSPPFSLFCAPGLHPRGCETYTTITRARCGTGLRLIQSLGGWGWTPWRRHWLHRE